MSLHVGIRGPGHLSRVSLSGATVTATPWPYTWALTHDAAGAGSSTMFGQHPDAPLKWIRTDAASGANYYITTDTISASGPPNAVMDWGLGGTDENSVETTVAGAPARVKAANIIIQLCGAYHTSSLAAANVVTKAQAIVADIGHSNFAFSNKHFDGAVIASSGGLDWHRIREVNRQLTALYPGQVTDPTVYLRYGYTPRDGTDTAAMLKDNVAVSLQGNATGGVTNHDDQAHLCGDDAGVGYTSGNHLMGRDVYAPFYESRETGGLPFIPHQRLFSGSGSTNQANGGLVCTVNFDSGGASLTGATVSIQGDTDFSAAIESGAIKIRRATATHITDGYRVMRLRVTKGGKSRDSWLKVYLGDLAPTGTYRTSLNNQWIAREADHVGGVQDTQKLSIAVGLKPVNTWGASNTKGIFTSQLGSAGGILLNVKATASQNLGLTVKNASNVIVVNFDSSTSQGFTVANGLRWYFASFDLTTAGAATGGGTGKVAIDANAATTSGTATLNATMRLFPPSLTNILNDIFATTAAGANPCDAEVAALWMAADYVDFTSTTTNRDLIRNASSKASVLGTTRGSDGPGVVAGVTPFLWMEGPAGNWAYGLNLAEQDLAHGKGVWDATDQAMMSSV